MVGHYPAEVVGFALIGVAAGLFFHVQLQLGRVGSTSFTFFKHPFVSNWGAPAEYLRVRKQYGWSGWPVYCLWPCLLIGVVCLVFGLLRP
jgi:hypothetical protein